VTQKKTRLSEHALATGSAKLLPPRDLLLRMLHALVLARQLEDRIERKLYRQGKILGGVYVGRGQEAISVGATLAFSDADVLFPSHRDIGVYLARGVTVERLLAQYLGREAGPTRGKDGNLHFGDLGLNLVSFISHLADTIPVAAGVGLAYRLQGLNRACGVFFGDGGSSRGDFHEGLNLAAVWKLPVVFICNNNQYAYSTPLKKTMAVPGVAERALGYGFPTFSIDGNDVVEVYRVAREAVERARSGGGPTLIEARSFRMTGHSAHDDASYVPRHLFAEWARKDPILRLKKRLLDGGIVDAAEIEAMEAEIEEQIDAAVASVDPMPFPQPESALADVYASPPYHAPPPPWRTAGGARIDIRSCQGAPLVPTAASVQAGGPAASGAAAGGKESLVTYVEAIRRGIWEEMEADPKVFILGEDVGEYGGAFKATDGLLTRFGAERVIDTPIAESGFVGAAIGAALQGLRPIVEMQFIDFISCAFDQITNFAAKSRYRWGAAVPIVVRGPCGGGVHGGPFHSQNVESFFLNTPGLKIVAPATAKDAYGLLRSAVRDDDPVLYFEHKFLYRRVREELTQADGLVPIGKAACRRRGRDLTVITFGAMVFKALEAAEALARDGVELEVLDLRTLLPLDKDAILESVARTHRALLLHEACGTGGIGGELAAIIAEFAFEYLDAPIRRIAAIDTPVPYSAPLEEYFLPQATDIVRVAKELVEF
jgi:pyruvate/2-oxoglutarate/acetoin dehydrogenase E1 component/TPP-dependent pyruvate/acetoin dehydrogenase alpha subunit